DYTVHPQRHRQAPRIRRRQAALPKYRLTHRRIPIYHTAKRRLQPPHLCTLIDHPPGRISGRGGYASHQKAPPRSARAFTTHHLRIAVHNLYLALVEVTHTLSCSRVDSTFCTSTPLTMERKLFHPASITCITCTTKNPQKPIINQKCSHRAIS